MPSHHSRWLQQVNAAYSLLLRVPDTSIVAQAERVAEQLKQSSAATQRVTNLLAGEGPRALPRAYRTAFCGCSEHVCARLPRRSNKEDERAGHSIRVTRGREPTTRGQRAHQQRPKSPPKEAEEPSRRGRCALLRRGWHRPPRCFGAVRKTRRCSGAGRAAM